MHNNDKICNNQAKYAILCTKEKNMLNDDIIRIIKKGASDQQELLEALIDLGHDLTQSSISRKLKQLGVVKVKGKYVLPKVEEKTIKDIVFIEPNLFVIRTTPGNASAVAAIIDEKLVENPQYPDFGGTIAGDDTIFVAVDVGSREYGKEMAILKKVIGHLMIK